MVEYGHVCTGVGAHHDPLCAAIRKFSLKIQAHNTKQPTTSFRTLVAAVVEEVASQPRLKTLLVHACKENLGKKMQANISKFIHNFVDSNFSQEFYIFYKNRFSKVKNFPSSNKV